MTGKNKQIKDAKKAMGEFEMAWQEFFKDKSEPKNDDEEKKEQEEFHHWYNHVRKQSDTGKTPVEMYKETYGKEPPENSTKISRMINFEWDEDYNEEKINPFVRYCPECDNWGLEVTGDVNLYECNICGSVWRRLKPLNDETGNMINMPKKLMNLIKEDKIK